ncbi:MAG: hypothetical protein HUU46_10675 [Candidatus Hydrogenedentes bacterium]|nr:hypothetical protein [Candidatus Hydrogenedentota bacterium]
MKRTVGIVITVLAFAAALAAASLFMPFFPAAPASSGGQPRAAATPPDTITILYTSDTRGHMNPCDCTAGVAGGLPRRKSFIAQRQSGDTLIVDAGNITAGGRPWELLELEHILRGYEHIGYDAINIGKREAGLPAVALAKLMSTYPALVSANVLDASGELIFSPFRLATLTSGYKVAIIGVTDSDVSPEELGEGVKVSSPEEAIARVLPRATVEADFIVLLAFVGEQKLKELAERFFEIDVIVGGDVKQPSGNAVAANKSTIVYITDKGKSVGELNLLYVGGQYIAEKNTITMLMENVPDDPGIAALAAELHRKLVENSYPTKKDDEDGLSAL